MAGEIIDPHTRQRKKITDRMACKEITWEEQSPAWVQKLLTKIDSIGDRFDEKFEELNDSIECQKKENRAVLNRMSNAEERIGLLEDQRTDDNKVISELTQTVNNLKTKVIQLESQSRRNNLVLLGLEARVLEGDNHKQVMDQILRYILDAKPTDPIPEVERQHRSLRAWPEPPRATATVPDPPSALGGPAAYPAGYGQQAGNLEWKAVLRASGSTAGAEYADIRKKLR